MNDNKVFISTGHYKNLKPIQTFNYLIKNNINDIEFSGGLPVHLKEEKKFFKRLKNHNVRLHNYFPAPKKKFVINLASKNKKILRRSINHIKKSISYSKQINGKYFSFHAGFRVDPGVKRLGKGFKKTKLTDKKEAESIFLKSVKEISKFAKKKNIKILIENNVVNKKNLRIFGKNPLLLTNPKDIINFFKRCPKNIGLLIDVGHLKVSARTEKFELVKSFKKLNKITEGYHFSDNNFIEDQNLGFNSKSWFFKHFRRDLNYYTLEIYNDNLNYIKKIKKTVEKYLNK